MANEKVGSEVTSDRFEGDDPQKITLRANAVGQSDAIAVGLDNSQYGDVDQGFILDLEGGNDLIRAFGTAGTLSDSGVTLGAGVLHNQGGIIDLGNGQNRIVAEGIATGTTDNQVEAYGYLTTQTIGGNGRDVLDGTADATGGNVVTASGVRVGTYEDNTVAVEGGEPFGNEAGRVDLGDGVGRILGAATGTTTSDGVGTFFNDVNGVLVDVASKVETGSAADSIIGRAEATDLGVGGGSILTRNAMSADGVELRGDVSLGGGADQIRGMAEGVATNSFTVVEGVDIGLGNNLNAALGGNPNLVNVTPVVKLGKGADKITGQASSLVEGNEAGTVSAGIQNVGTVNTGAGDDILRGTATSVVMGGQNGIRGAIADGVQNFVINEALRVDQDGTINLGAGDNEILGRARAQGEEFIAFATGIAGGVLTAKGGDDLLDGRASASGRDEVGSIGVYLVDADLGAGDNLIRGRAMAEGAASTDARGISVGLSDIDDDSLQNPQDSSRVQAGQIGRLLLGSDNDTLSGTANVTVAAQDGDEIFFVGGNGIVNDGGLIGQFEDLLKSIGKDLTNFDASDVERIIGDLETSTLDTGAGDDTLIAKVTLDVSQDGQGADDDLEVIGDGIENAGFMTLGDGDDEVRVNVDVTSTVVGAKGLADSLDNSSVGIITGLNLEVNRETVFDLGKGNDRFTSNISATAVDDLAAADGLGNRGTILAGTGDDSFDLKAEARFVLANENDSEQQEGIADGWENRSDVFLGAGDDTVNAKASAFGEGVLTIAEGLESRGLFDTGSGDDRLDLKATATTAAVSPRGQAALPDNLTQAAGLQTEQIEEGRFLTRGGNDAVVARAVAKSEAKAGKDANGVLYTPSTFAFGISQMTADANNTDSAAGTGLIHTGRGQDILDGTAIADGKHDVAAFGLLFENTKTGAGADALNGSARAVSGDVALATGIAVGVEDDVFLKTNSLGGSYGLGTEAGKLNTGKGVDILTAKATAKGDLSATARGIDGANGIINLGTGADKITADARANVTNPNGDVEAIGIYGGVINAGAGDDDIVARSNTRLVGDDGKNLAGGQGFGGEVQINLGKGDDTIMGFGDASLDGGDGYDTLQFEFSLEEFVKGGGVIEDGKFTFAGKVLDTANFEEFQFNVDIEDRANTEEHPDEVQVFESLTDLETAFDELVF